jgi:diguanylate cyclase
MAFTHYDLKLAIYSFLIACFLCYLSVSLAENFLLRHRQTVQNKIFILLSGFFLGLAVWSTYFLSVLVLHIPSEYRFDYALMLVSFAITFVASTLTVWITAHFSLTPLRLILGATLMGLGISAMHYICTMGLLVDHYTIVYHAKIMACATIFAVVGVFLTYVITAQLKKIWKNSRKVSILFAILMAVSIMGTHYLGILSISFNEEIDYKYQFLIKSNHSLILFSIILISSVIFLVLGLIAFLEQRLTEKNLQLEKANDDLANQAIYDNLTKLPNRLYLREYAQRLFARYDTKSQNAIFHIDIDRFKVVNDVFGYHIGDRLLIQFANKIHKNLDNDERVFRLSGDEFILILENTNKDKVIEKAEQLQKLIASAFMIEGNAINISMSIGIALQHEHGNNLHELLKSADSAMLQAKKQGRNTYHIFNDSEDLLDVYSHPQLMNDLYKAVEENQFILFYQPKFTAKTHHICGVEALIRWEHDTYGLLTPDKFIRGAETTGLIIQLGYLVLEEAFKQIQKWEQSQADFFPVAVNLSAVQFEHKELFFNLEKLFEKYKIEPQHLTIEITESIAMQNIEMSILRFERLHQMGVKLAIDDFGTGHSSLLYLKNLSVDELKIDRAFIQNIENNSKSEIILESIIKLAMDLGLIVTVEGVETTTQAEKLTTLGCQQLQGFLFANPMPANELEQWIKHH